MFQKLLVCLDGSALAEKILPVARALTSPRGGKLTLLRIVPEAAALEDDHMRECARRYTAELRFLVSDGDPAAAIGAELERDPQAIAALTTHGRTAWAEAILGNVALRVVREARRPVVVFRPLTEDREAPTIIGTVAVALDGSKFSEKIIPYAAKAAHFLSARLLLLQALPVHPPPMTPLTDPGKTDVLESSYLQRQAAAIKAGHDIDAQWEVLHGEPADALCRYLNDMPETLLAITTHARGGLERAVIGSVAATCVRHAGVPLLLYWPRQ
jgi:nucleotide-binding universal stress UspA family protein